MNRSVIKFGGSDLKTNHDIKRIMEILRMYNRPVLVVFSAFYGVTDMLIKALEKAEKGFLDTDALIQEITMLKERTLSECIEDRAVATPILSKVKSLIAELREFLVVVSYMQEVTSASRALILSYGERMSALCLSEVFKANGLDAVLRKPEDLKLITDGDFSNATVDFNRSEVCSNFPTNTIIVVPGYYAVSPEGKTTLLGRGGSDYAAAAYAYCLDAPSLDLWKDVKGFMSGDPKLVENPQCIDVLAYNEAAELSYFGAKILHPRTVEPLKLKNIPINLYSINGDITALNPATVISQRSDDNRVIKGVTYTDDYGVLKLKGTTLGVKPGVLGDVTSTLNRGGININSVLTSQIAINIILAKSDLAKAKQLIEELNENSLVEIELWDDVSLLAVVGNKIMNNYGVSSRILAVIDQENIKVRMNCAGASPIVNYFIIDKEDTKRAIQAIHNGLFNA